MMLPAFAYARARSLDEAVALLSPPGTRAARRGTDLLGCLRDEVFTAEDASCRSPASTRCSGISRDRGRRPAHRAR